MSINNRLTLTVLLPLLIGAMIYILFRDDSIKMFSWFEKIGIGGFLKIFRESISNQSYIPKWIIFSLPDALWAFSFTNIMLIMWQDKITKSSVLWILLAPAIAILSEVGQALKIVHGTFDILDLILLFIFSIAPILHNYIVIKPKNNEKAKLI